MDGPEQLEAGTRPSQRRTWVLVLVLVAVVAGLGAVRLTGLVPAPAPTPTVSTGPTVDPADTAWPHDLGQGTLYAVDQSGLVVIDLGSGLVQRPDYDVRGIPAQLTAYYTGVLVWSEDGHGKPRLITAAVPDVFRTGGLVAEGRQFLPGPDGSVWVTRAEAYGSRRRTTWRLVDESEVTTRAEVELEGDVLGDGAGGLFAVDDLRVRHVVPGKAPTTWSGEVLALGPDGAEVATCRPQCRYALRDHATGQDTPITWPVPADLDLGTLSPGNRFVASVEQAAPDDSDATVVRVTVPGSQKELRSFPASEDEETLTWVSDHWLVADGKDGLVLYDAAADRLVTPAIGLSTLSALVYQPA